VRRCCAASCFVGKLILAVRLISISGIRLPPFLLLFLSAQAFGSGPGSYSHLVVSYSGAASPDGVVSFNNSSALL
jgi:hypothetical protein